MLRIGGELFLAIPFLIQFGILAIDEFYCHRRRTLRKWERIGHPIDTFTFTLCFLPVLFMDPEKGAGTLAYFGLSALSCLMITKDEWEHRELSGGFENWLHSLLFILHPLVLVWMYMAWRSGNPHAFGLAINMVVATLAIGFYQLFYWNFRRDQQ
jgi:hypothetical protein